MIAYNSVTLRCRMDSTGGAGRASVITIRLTQVALAAMAVTAGGSKLAKVETTRDWIKRTWVAMKQRGVRRGPGARNRRVRRSLGAA